MEYFARLRSLDAIKRTDVVFLVLDAMEGVTQQDKAIAGEIVKEAKPVVIVVNKWDLVHESFQRPEGVPGYESEREFREKFEHALFERLFFTPGAPVVFVSALSGYEIDRMLNAAVKLHRQLDGRLPTARLNQTLIRLAERTPPPAEAGKRFRIYYAVQTGNRPFRIRVVLQPGAPPPGVLPPLPRGRHHRGIRPGRLPDVVRSGGQGAPRRAGGGRESAGRLIARRGPNAQPPTLNSQVRAAIRQL